MISDLFCDSELLLCALNLNLIPRSTPEAGLFDRTP